MPSALYLLGRRVESLKPLLYIEPFLNIQGIQVREREIVPVTDLKFYKSSILVSLASDNDFTESKILDAITQAYSDLLKIGENGDSFCFERNNILEIKLDEHWNAVPYPPFIHRIAYFRDKGDASGKFKENYDHYEAVYMELLRNRAKSIITPTSI